MAKFIRRGVRTIQILSIIGLALPLCALIGLYLSININLVEKLPIPDLIGKLIHDANLRDGIETGNDPEQLKQLYINMMDKSAIAADATIAEKLNIVFVRFNANQSADNKSISKQATRRLKLDLTKSGSTATLLVSNRPLLIDVQGGSDQPHAKLAVEGRHPFDLIGAPDGLLAGFRIEAFGARQAATLDALDDGGSRRMKRHYCSLIKRWRSFFEVSPSAVRVWQVADPDLMKSTESQIFNVNGTSTHRWLHVPRCN